MKDVKGISLVKDNGLITIQSTQLEAMSPSLRVLMLGDWVTLEGPPCQKAYTNLRYLRVGDIAAFPCKDPSKLDKLKVFQNRSKPGMNLSHLPSSLKRICHEVPHVECDKFVKLPLKNLKSLQNFMVETSKSVELPEGLHLPSSLVHLGLNRCKNLPKDMNHLIALESLILDRSDLEYLPQGFGKLQKLKRFSLDYCSKLAFLCEELGMLSSLETLSMKGCEHLRALPESLGGLLSLQTLEFSGCINLQELPESLGELRIQSFDLHSLDNLNKLPNSFGQMPLLKNLSLESCHSLMSLPKSFVQLKFLETLNIMQCNKLSLLPEDFGRLRCLKHMTVEECHLLKELPHDFGALPALKIFTLGLCNSFVNLPKDFTELTSLERLRLYKLPLMSSSPDGFGKLKKLRFLNVHFCAQLKTLSDDFENMATLERQSIISCSELDGAMMEKIVKLPNCYRANIYGSRKLSEKWEQMQRQSEHPIGVLSGEEERDLWRAMRVALLHGKCMEVNYATSLFMERSSLLEEGLTATVALIMLPIRMQSHHHQTLERCAEMAWKRAESNGSDKLQIVCARKVELDAERATAREEEEREEDIRQILLSLPKGSCAIPSSQSKRLKLLTWCCIKYDYSPEEFSFFMVNVRVDMKFTTWDHISVNIPSPPETRKAENKHYNSIQNFIKSICATKSQSERVAGESKTRKFTIALKDNEIHYLFNDNNKSQVLVDDLHGKAIGFIICDFKFLECIKLQQIYKHLQHKDSYFIWIWIPTVLSQDYGHGAYKRLIQCMPWATFPHPQLVNVEVGDPCFVLLDKHGQIANHDALPLLLAWGAECYPFNQHTISESLSVVESESWLEILLHGMNIVGRKPMRNNMTFLYAEDPSECLGKRSKLEELTQIHGSFEVLYVGKFYAEDVLHMEDVKQEYEDVTQSMRWASLSFSNMIMFWYRCKYLAREKMYVLNKESNMMMEPLHQQAEQLYHCERKLVLVDKDGAVVTNGGLDVVRMICESSDESWDGKGMGMVKDELMKSLSSGECSPIVKTFFRDEIHDHPQHPQHPISVYPTLVGHVCDVCLNSIEDDGGRIYSCDECDWDMCGSCWKAYAKQQVQHLARVKDD